ncbi:MAG: histone deacetylase, partial [Syntrophales bacterium]|nr:histone deacetylase [Syntrophales bacterium]
IAIVDTDCHHGDGTQDIYWHDPDTLFISMHQDGRTLYPGSGAVDEFGGPNAFGNTINIPLPPMTSDKGFLYALDHVILPILEDFKPDIVINSAGQDNHYSDPITNMRFSAQGYALLNEKLAPDIAVLEGGYSIEKALPYVNVGIILAMAGLDYSQIREPDYNAAALKQSDDINRYIEKVSEQVYGLWKKRGSLRKSITGRTGYMTRRKRIYYDTDGISEHQEETVRVCEECGGMIMIDSEADTGRHILAFIVPGRSCSQCRHDAESRYAETSKGKYNYIYFQDRDRDIFLVK